MAANKKPHGKSPARLTSVSIVLHGKSRREKQLPVERRFPLGIRMPRPLQQVKKPAAPGHAGASRKVLRQMYEYQNFTGRQPTGMPAPQKNVEPVPLGCGPAYALLMQPTARWGSRRKLTCSGQKSVMHGFQVNRDCIENSMDE